MSPDILGPQRYEALDGKTFLICVGAAKCATTWLFGYLESLHGVVVSPLKEVHFFDAKFPDNALSDMDALAVDRLRSHFGQEDDPVRNLMQSPALQASVDRLQMIYDDDAYFRHFARLCTRDTQTFCDVTPAYASIGPDGFSYMREFCASQDIRTRILFLMRDPIDRLWSQLRHMTQVSPATNLAANWYRALESPRIMARSDYRGTVWDIDEAFPAEDALYLFYEDLFEDTALQRLCAFAGISYRRGSPETVSHQTELKLDLPDDAREAFRRALDPQYAFCRERFGEAVPRSWRG